MGRDANETTRKKRTARKGAASAAVVLPEERRLNARAVDPHPSQPGRWIYRDTGELVDLPDAPPDDWADALTPTEELLDEVRELAERLTEALERAQSNNADAIAASRQAAALGIRPPIFRLGIKLSELDQRQRDRWFSEFQLVIKALGITLQRSLF